MGQLAKLLMAIHVKSRKPPDDDSSGKGDVTMTSGGVLRPESEELYGSKGEREDSPGGASTGEGKHGSKESGRVAGKDASTGEFERLTPEEEFRRLSPGNVPLEEIPLGVDPRERLAAYHAAYGGRGAADEESLRKIRKELEKERARLMQEWKRRERLARKPAAKPVVPPVRKLLTSASSIGRRREARDSGGRNDSSGGEAELVEKGKGKEAEERKEGTTEGGKLYSKTWPQEQRVKGGSAFAFVATETETQEGRKPANAGGNISTVEAAGTSHQAPAGEGSVLAPEPEPLAPERRKTETVSEIEAAPCTTSSHGARARDVAVPRAGAPPPDVEETAGRQLLEDVEEDEAEQDSAAERERERNPLAIPIPHADERARPIEEDDLARLVYIPSLQKGFRQWKGLAMVNASEAAFMRAIAERPRFVIW